MVLIEPQVWNGFFLHDIFGILVNQEHPGWNEQLLKIKILEILYFFSITHSFRLCSLQLIF